MAAFQKYYGLISIGGSRVESIVFARIESDFYVIQGVVFVIIVSIGLATLILDLVYPALDPRISYARK